MSEARMVELMRDWVYTGMPKAGTSARLPAMRPQKSCVCAFSYPCHSALRVVWLRWLR